MALSVDEVLGILGSGDKKKKSPNGYDFTPPPEASPYMEAIRAAEQKHGIPENLLARVIQQESGFNPNAVSKKGARGIAQIMPDMHPKASPDDPYHSIDYAAGYLRQNADRFGGDWNSSVASYNAGPGTVEKNGLGNLPEETRGYLKNITGYEYKPHAQGNNPILTDDQVLSILGSGQAEPGLIKSTLGDIAGGVVDMAEMYARAGRALPGGEEYGRDQGGMMSKVIGWAERFKKENPNLDVNPNRKGFSRWFHEGVRSAATSLSAGLPGMLAGAAAGSFASPVGSLVGGLVGYAANAGTVFGLAETDSFLEEADKAGVSRSESEPAAIRSGIYEGGFEAASDLIGGYLFGGGKLLTNVGKESLKEGVASLMKVSAKEAAKRFAGIAAVETGSEMLTAGFQAEERNKLGMTDQKFLSAAIDAFGPSLVAAMIFGGVHSVREHHVHNNVKNALANPETDLKKRMGAVNAIHDELKDFDPDIAKSWKDTASLAIMRGESIDLNSPIKSDPILDRLINADMELGEKATQAAVNDLQKPVEQDVAKWQASTATAESPMGDDEAAKDIINKIAYGQPLTPAVPRGQGAEELREQMRADERAAAEAESITQTSNKEQPEIKAETPGESLPEQAPITQPASNELPVAEPEPATQISGSDYGLSEQQDAFIRNKVDKLGSIEAVDQTYNGDDEVNRFARDVARERFAVNATGVNETQPERRIDIKNRKDFEDIISRAADVEEAREIARAMADKAYTDPMMGLNNKAAWIEHQLAEKDTPNDQKTWKAVYDVDNFSWYNDALGHAVGDDVLTKVGKIMQEEAALPFRFGGEELANVEGNDDAARERLIAQSETIRKRLENEIEFEHTLAQDITLDSGEKYKKGDTIVVKGIGISYGIGRTQDEADQGTLRNKEERTSAGLRSPKGHEAKRVYRFVSGRLVEGGAHQSGNQGQEVTTEHPAQPIPTEKQQPTEEKPKPKRPILKERREAKKKASEKTTPKNRLEAQIEERGWKKVPGSDGSYASPYGNYIISGEPGQYHITNHDTGVVLPGFVNNLVTAANKVMNDWHDGTNGGPPGKDTAKNAESKTGTNPAEDMKASDLGTATDSDIDAILDAATEQVRSEKKPRTPRERKQSNAEKKTTRRSEAEILAAMNGFFDLNDKLPKLKEALESGRWPDGKELTARDRSDIQKEVDRIEKGEPKNRTTPKERRATKKELAKKAGVHTVEGVKEAYKGLAELFSMKYTLGSGPVFDEDTYAKAKPHFENALKNAIEAGYTLKELAADIIRTFSEDIRPYLSKFLKDKAKSGNVELEEGQENEPVSSQNDVPPESGLSRDGGSLEGKPGSTGQGDQGSPDTVERLRGGTEGQGDTGTGTEGAGQSLPGADRGRPGRGMPGRRSAIRDTGVGGSQGGRVSEGTQEKVAPEDSNHVIAADDVIAPKGIEGKINANIKAIELLKILETENRNPTPAEKKVLAQYVGWGAFSQKIFNPEYDRAANSGQDPEAYYQYDADGLKKFHAWKNKYGQYLHPAFGGMTEDEWKSAAASTTNAHYTSKEVVAGMWKLAERLGFKGGTVLEPAAGVGNFFGLMPQGVAGKSVLFGVEKDTLSGRILTKLYPQANIEIGRFEKSRVVTDNSMDLVITNVPFSGKVSISDKRHPDYDGWKIHNYFIARSIDAARPGGLVMAISSAWSLDAKGNGKIREYFGKKADLVGAMRLPNTAFKDNAGTEVVTDILVFRKKDGDGASRGETFRHVGYLDTKEFREAEAALNKAREDLAEIQKKRPPKDAKKEALAAYKRRYSAAKEAFDNAMKAYRESPTVNEYFINNPDMVLGKHSMTGSMYAANTYTVEPTGNIESQLATAVESFPEDIAGEGVDLSKMEKVELAGLDSKEGTVTMKDGAPKLIENGRIVEPYYIGSKGEKMPLKPNQVQRLKRYIELRDLASEAIQAMGNEATTDAQVKEYQKRLTRLYDKYVKKFGAFNGSVANSFLNKIDNDFALVDALEVQVGEGSDAEWVKAPIFTQRTVFPFVEPTKAETVEDAVNLSLVYRGKISLPYLSDLLGGKDVESIKQDVVESGIGFFNPDNGMLEQRDLYLSGNVKKKLKRAKLAAETDKSYQANVEALEKVIPEDIDIGLVSFRLGSTWIPADTVRDFLKEVVEVDATVDHVKTDTSSRWVVTPLNGADGVKNRETYASGDVTALGLLDYALNLRMPKVIEEVRDENGNWRKYEDKEKSREAKIKLDELSDEFVTWARGHDKWANELTLKYNDEKNGVVLRTHSAPKIDVYPNASPVNAEGKPLRLTANQKRAVSRALQESCLLAYGVGTGKTFILITTAMEMKRIGTARKPMIVAHNSTIDQFRNSFKLLYPGAKVLIPDDKQRNARYRKKLLISMSTGDWDAIVLPQSFFDGIANDPERERAFVDEQIEIIEEAIEEARDAEGARSFTVKDLENLKENRIQRLDRLLDRRKDEVLTFEKMGIDALLIDEAHAYKRSEFYTKLSQVKGIDNGASQRSTSLILKSENVREKTGGKNMITATGTPISNTLAELWTMLRYVRPDLLEEYGVSQFDDFATSFGIIDEETEQTAKGFVDVQRFKRYVNGPELMSMFFSGADVLLTRDADLKLPKLKGGKPTMVINEKSPDLTRFIKDIIDQWKAWEQLPGREKRKQRHVPIVLYGLAKKAAVDMRLIDPDYYPDDPNSKVNQCAREVARIYEENRAIQGTQIIFCDMINDNAKKPRFNLHEDIKAKLIKAGIPENEIDIFPSGLSDVKEDAIKKRFRAGISRVIIGTTERLGIGVDIADKIVAGHHLTVPDRPMDMEQRDGRFIRQSNKNPEVEKLQYATKDTLDPVMFQRMATKQKGADQVLTGDISGRDFDDPYSQEQAEFSEFAAASSGKAGTLLFEKSQLNSKMHKHRIAEQAHSRRVAHARRKLNEIPEQIERAEKRKAFSEDFKAHTEKAFPDGKVDAITFEGKTMPRKEAYEQIRARIDAKIKEWEKNFIGKPMGDFRKKAQSSGSRYFLSEPFHLKAGEIDISFEIEADTDFDFRAKASTKLHWKTSIDFETNKEVAQKIQPFAVRLQYKGHTVGVGHTSESNMESGLTRIINRAIADSQHGPANDQERIDKLTAEDKEFGNIVKEPFKYRQEMTDIQQRLSEIDAQLRALTSDELLGEDAGDLDPERPSSKIIHTTLAPEKETPRTGYHIHHWEEGFKPVDGKPVDIPGFHAFIHKDKSGWIVTEAVTGVAFGRAGTKIEAINNALEKIDKHGADFVREQIADLVKEHGKSPWADGRDDLLYSAKGRPTISRARDIEDAIFPIIRQWERFPVVRVVQSIDQLPKSVREKGKAYQSTTKKFVEAAYDGDQIYFIADHIEPDRVEPLLFHEAVAHQGLRGLMGSDLHPFLDQVARAKFHELRKVNPDLTWIDDEARRRAAEEWLAEKAEQGQVPEKWWDRMVAAVRKWIRNNLRGNMKLTDTEIKVAINDAFRYMREGKPGAGSGTDGTMRFSARALPFDIAGFKPPTSDGGGRNTKAPTTTDVYEKYLPVETAKRIRGAKLSHAPLKERFASFIKDTVATFKPGNMFPSLDKPAFAKANEILRNATEVSNYSKWRAVEDLREILSPKDLTSQQYDVFSLKLILDDLLHDIETEGAPLYDWETKHGELPFGFQSTDEVRDSIARVDASINKDDGVREALERRREYMKNLRVDLVRAGMLRDEVLDDERYFHHQVLEYANLKHGAGTGSQDFRVGKKGYQLHRVGSIKDYNTEYAESEFEVLAQGIAQLEMKKNLDEIDQEYNIIGALRQSASLANHKAVVGSAENWERLRKLRARKAYLQGMGSGRYSGETRKELKEISDEIWELDPTMPFRQKIAMGMAALKGEEGDVDNINFKEIARLSENGNPNAAKVLKAVNDRKQFYIDTLGRHHNTWQTEMEKRMPLEGSEGWTEWIPKPGSAWYMTSSLNDKLIEQVLSGSKILEEADLRRVMARGYDARWVVPAELAGVLDGADFMSTPAENVVAKAAEDMLNWWKRWILINPMRVLKYNINNMSGDLDIALAYDPGILKYAKQAAKDLHAVMKRKGGNTSLAREIDAAMRDGVIGSGMTVHDIPDIKKLDDFDRMMDALRGEKKSAIGYVKKLWDTSKEYTNFRENILRLAAYRHFKDQIRAGKKVYGASDQAKVDATTDVERKAALLARELIGDYGNLSKGGQWLRKKAIPFYSWMEINAPRYWRLFKNIPIEGEPGGRVARLSGVGLKKTAALSLKATMLYAAINIFNHLFWPDEEEELGDQGRRQLHLILGRNDDGSIRTLRLQGALSDALGWVGLEDAPQDFRELAEGKKYVSDMVAEAVKAPVNKLGNAIRPDIKTPMELVTGKTTYPDLFNPRPIRDKAEHVARMFSLESAYRRFQGRPSKEKDVFDKVLSDLGRTVTYSSDPGEAAYNDTRSMVFKYLENQGIERPAAEPTNKSNALYYYRQAIKLGDGEAAQRYLKQYLDLGGNYRGMRTSVKRAHPLAAVPRRLRLRFMAKLNGADRDKVRRAVDWYNTTYMARGA